MNANSMKAKVLKCVPRVKALADMPLVGANSISELLVVLENVYVVIGITYITKLMVFSWQ